MAKPPHHPARFGLVLQSGGALGAYQAGVLEALSEAGKIPDLIGGLSIGAVNGALFASAPPDERVSRLRDFWTSVTTQGLPFVPQMRRWNGLSSLLQGQHGFFRPRPFAAWLTPDPRSSFYDVSELAATLTRLIDVDALNAGPVRFAAGATDAQTGELVIFDTAQRRVGVQHLLASGALPPNFPALEIEGRILWDGALAATSLLEWMADAESEADLLVFQVDMFRPDGPPPAGIDFISERKNDVSFAARTRAATRLVERVENLSARRRLEIVNLIYRPAEPQGRTKDFDFDRDAMRDRWAQGLADARDALAAAPWLSPGATPCRVFDTPRPAAI